MKKWIHTILPLLFWPLGFLLSCITAFFPKQVEVVYARGFSKIVTEYLSRVTGFVPFSLAELIVWAFVISVFLLFLQAIIVSLRARSSQRNQKKGGLLLRMIGLLVLLGIVYFGFILVWGINYNRLPFAEIAGFKVDGYPEKDLEQLCEKLVVKANRLRINLPENEQGIIKIEGGFQEIRMTAPQGYAKAALIYPELGGIFGQPKPVFFSKLMSYTGISGIYFPFTGEANVNTDIPDPILPAATCHEMAHQRGFAREDEANYLAWVACSCSTVPQFQYSGTLFALIYAMNALYENDPIQAAQINNKYGPGLRRDFRAISQYWKQYEGKVEEFTSDVNDTYLKSNWQREGVESYGRMVDLLLAEQSTDPGKKFLP
ncbi:MAG: hypothetical protein AWM53_01521 [Candidatus Dichloromethanomonas elyunquensis]|nr:MAG: hypothetical protein AWM53_01521 [Candidatus Dichloromethanomonas elyunquensis]